MIAVRFLVILALLASTGGRSTRRELVTIAEGDRSHIEDARQAVVRTGAQWKAIWTEHAGTGAAPAVDFNRSMVIGVFAGSRPTAGYAIQITQIEATEAGIVVTYRERRPAPDAIVAQVLTAPFHIVRTRRASGRVTFRRDDDAPGR